jgi:hypothetical protein
MSEVIMLKLQATVEIDKIRNTRWLRFNKGEAHNRLLIYELGPVSMHHTEITVIGSEMRFRIWWKSEKSKPYLEALINGDWRYDAAFDEIKRITRLPMKNMPGKPDKIAFYVQYQLSW